MSWREALETLDRTLGPVTAKQSELASFANIILPDDLPQLVAAARIRTALRKELCSTVHSTSAQQLEYLRSLDPKRSRDPAVMADCEEASAWINFHLLSNRRRELGRLKLETGDVVTMSNPEALLTVTSIGDDGAVYFKGGRSRAWPDSLKVSARAASNSARARKLRQVAENYVSMFGYKRHWSNFKEAELARYKVSTNLTDETIDRLESVIDNAEDEKPIQAFIETHPEVLAWLLRGISQFVVSRPSLGGKHIPDFLISDTDSFGIRWILIELETPLSKVTLKDHNLLDKYARKGESQITEWREWLQDNLHLARRSQQKHGLGLIDIRPQSEGVVLVGRRSLLHANSGDIRLPISEQKRIHIHTYDWLIERLRA